MLAEFVIALPLLILLIYTLTNIFLNVSKPAEKQSADYILEEEAHEILDRITKDARAAYSLKLEKYDDRQDLEIVFHAMPKNSGANIIDVLDTRRYILYSKKENFTVDGHEKINHVYVHRKNVSTPTSPISGDNFFGDTTVKELKFTVHEKVLHISLKIKSLKTERIICVNTSVFMPACEKIEGF